MGKIKYVYSPGLGKRIAAEVCPPLKQPPKHKRKPFKTEYVQFPGWWIERLCKAKGSTILLALIILAEAFKREHVGGDIVLSSAVTKMPRTTRMQAVKELVELGLIVTSQRGHQAAVVSHVNYDYPKGVLKSERRVLKTEH